MHLRTLGDSSLPVSEIGLGLAALGRPGYINLGHGADLGEERSVEAMEARAHEVLDAALEGGVRYFDAARSYGLAERFLASWAEARRPRADEATIGSKWGYRYTAGWRTDAEVHEVKEHSLPMLREQWRESRSLLGGRLGIYQIHSATLESGVLDNRPVLEELARLRATEGVRIGLSLSGPSQAETLRKALGVRVEGERVFDAVQATWNLLEPTAEEALREARAEGVGVIVKEALANGRLTERNRDRGFRERLSALRAEAARLETTVDALSLAAALARPWADVVLSGAATTEQLRSNLAAPAVRWDEEAVERLGSLAEPPAEYWRTRADLAWT